MTSIEQCVILCITKEVIMKPYHKILSQAYTVVEAGRGSSTQFDMPRQWVRNACPEMWKRYKKDPQPFQLFWSEPNTSKFHGSIVYGEYVPFEGNRLVIIHNTNLQEQHTDHLNHWIKEGYVRKHWRVMTIQRLDRLVKKVNAGKQLDEQEQRDIDFINEVSFLVLDELHRYSKNDKDKIQMLTSVMEYMLMQNLKLALGTTATARGITAAWEIFGGTRMYINQKHYTYRTTIEELSVEGWKPVPTSYIWADSKTTLDDGTDQWIVESESEHEVNDDLKQEGHDLVFNKDERELYYANRVDAGVEHYTKHHAGSVGIMSINGMQNALAAEEKYNQTFEALGYACIAWNSETKNNHTTYKDDEKKMLEDLFNPEHPLRFVFVNGMLQEGTNKPFEVAYQANYSIHNPDRSIQFGARAKEAFIIIDAAIMKGLRGNPYVSEMIEDIHNRAREVMDPEEIQAKLDKLEAALQIEAARQNSILEDGKEPDVEIDIDYIFDSLVNGSDDDDDDMIIINGKRVFVYDVNHNGNLVKVPLNIGGQIHRSLNQKATALMDVLGA